MNKTVALLNHSAADKQSFSQRDNPSASLHQLHHLDSARNELRDLPSVSIIIPVYNSEATLERLCLELIGQMSTRWRLQIVLVDDGSRDNSAAVCRELHHLYPQSISCVLLSRNFGEHNAVMAGLN